MASSLFSRLERWLGTDLRYLISGGFALSLGQVGIGLIAFGVSVAFAHFVSKETYGTYRFLLAAFWTISAFSLSGIGTAMSRAVARGAEGTYKASFIPFLVGSFPITLIGIGAAIYYDLSGNTLLAGSMLVIGILGPFFQPSYLFGPFLDGKKLFAENAVFGVIGNVVPALALLLAMLLTQNSLVFLTVYLGITALTGFVLCFLAYRRHHPNDVQDSTLINLSLHLSANSILGAFSQQADDLFVYHTLGAAPLAIYSFATALPDQVKNLVSSISSVAFPKFAARPLGEIRATLLWRLTLFALGLAIATVIYWLIAPFFFHLFFPAYSASIWYSELYALTLVPSINVMPLTILQAHAAKQELYILSIASAIFQIIALVILITFYGLLGAVIARILSRVFALVLGLWLVYRIRV